jgi:glycosyltransferase involved in cell wall biosynthesis
LKYTLSVVVPTLNRKKPLFRLLDSLCLQKNVSLQIIIIDQNSPSFFTSQELLFLSKFRHIKTLKKNVSYARNLGFSFCIYPLVLFIDDDLVLEDYFCFNAVVCFNDHPFIKCLIPNVYSFKNHNFIFSNFNSRTISSSFCNGIYILNEAISAAFFITSECFILTGGFDYFLFDFAKSGEDQEFFLRLREKGNKIWFNEFLLVFHEESNLGGCEFRTTNDSQLRKRFIHSWCLRYRIHSQKGGRISFIKLFKIFRSAFLNKEILLSGPIIFVINIFYVLIALIKSKKYYLKYYSKQNYFQSGFLIKRHE